MFGIEGIPVQGESGKEGFHCIYIFSSTDCV